ncbi:S8 family serine peptidase [Streptomyces sp. NPDC001876]|uniref:S8 family serine peptidase n=1 Tax=Streptomyces sp. NPDC001876 TaxID=3154402 RepID=UPI00332DAB6B
MNRLSRMALATLVMAVPGIVGTHASTAADSHEPTYVVVLKDSVVDPAATSVKNTERYGGARQAVFSHALKGYAATMTPTQATALGNDPSVRFVTREDTYRSSPSPVRAAVRCKELQGEGQCLPDWADRINAERSSTRSGDGRGSVDVNVAIIDSGIAGNQPDLNVKGGTDCLTGTPVAPGDSLNDVVGQGTARAGVVGAKDNNIGVVGVAPGTPVWAVKVFPNDGGPASDAAVLCAIDWVTSTRTDNDATNDIAVANMSFSKFNFQEADDGNCGAVNQDAMHVAVCNAVKSGVTLVASAGNFRYDLAGAAPASYDEVITATAMADFDGRPGGDADQDCYGSDAGLDGHADDQASLLFSNFARSQADRRHTVAAPGVCIETTGSPGFPYVVEQGTNYAAPAVTGVAALCIAKGRCGTSSPGRNLRTIVDDATKYNRSHPRYGFLGDPLRPIKGRYYGPLVAANRY